MLSAHLGYIGTAGGRGRGGGKGQGRGKGGGGEGGGGVVFFIYINDIVGSSNLLKSIHFADDTNIFF